jgi:hypothetical protein
MKKTKKNAGTTLDADLAGYSAAATTTLAKKTRRRKLSRTCLGFGAATSAALLASTGLEAAIVYSGLQNIVLNPAGNGSATTAIDVDGDAVPDFILSQRNWSGGNGGANYHTGSTTYNGYWTGSTWNYRSGTARIQGQNGGLVSGSAFYANRLSSGQRVGTYDSNLRGSQSSADIARIYTSNGFSTFSASFQSSQFTNGNFPSSQAGFLGVKLGSGNFGWIQVHASLHELEIIDWAYDDSGKHIEAGNVPEPALLGLGLLSLGAAGVRELRRRKREAEEKVSEPTPTA